MRPARLVAVAGTSGLVVFQLALAAGAPWGRLAWGGRHEGALPTDLRIGSAASAVVWGGALVAAAIPDNSPQVARVRTAYAVLAGVGAVVNAVSPSRPERLLWTHVAGALACGFWRLSEAKGPPVTAPDDRTNENSLERREQALGAAGARSGRIIDPERQVSGRSPP